jgi:hypothetical protein
MVTKWGFAPTGRGSLVGPGNQTRQVAAHGLGQASGPEIKHAHGEWQSICTTSNLMHKGSLIYIMHGESI